MNDDARPISVEEAKRRLLEWSDEADEGLRQELQQAIESVKGSARRAVPWAAGAAAVLGFLMLKGRKGGGEGAEGGEGLLRRGVGVLRAAIRVGMFVLPLAKPFFNRRGRRD